ncbi:uncharacterized protein I303_101784 [Kwoniella dejecticola CBS 10117]|uniref:Uncharacterized protein n=1 Tax=Kwoniella dejecticola CBS 10117 TaxID=1296121 RepID=A0A1A6ACT4_9TREE|nr:uncharacterized protein I303_02080 [Kwoniella dejecticola CBS 10117]OBR87866.1 hypothetical protein I303_02080 [Kwoniella dejecticola CBS 10117]
MPQQSESSDQTTRTATSNEGSQPASETMASSRSTNQQGGGSISRISTSSSLAEENCPGLTRASTVNDNDDIPENEPGWNKDGEVLWVTRAPDNNEYRSDSNVGNA